MERVGRLFNYVFVVHELYAKPTSKKEDNASLNSCPMCQPLNKCLQAYQYNCNCREMYVCVCLLVVLKSILSDCVTIERYAELSSKTKIELNPYVIKCLLNDIVIISAPELYTKSTYYLHSPNNEVTKLNIPRKNSKREHSSNIVIKYSNNIKSIINEDTYRLFNMNSNKSVDVLSEKEKFMRENEFMIGPLLESDHGNWVLSVFFKDLDDEYVELFQVITVEITEYIPLTPKKGKIKQGETLYLSFEFPIPLLESCQLTAPNTTFDRFFDRNRIELDRCGFVVPNISKEDQGLWSIIGVGRVIYEGDIFITVGTS